MLTRRQRARLAAGGFGIATLEVLAVGVGNAVAGTNDSLALWIGSAAVGIGAAAYVAGLAIAAIVPDRVRNHRGVRRRSAEGAPTDSVVAAATEGYLIARSPGSKCVG